MQTDLQTRRSTTGLVLCLAGRAVTCKSKFQATVATFSAELEFIAAMHATKVTKCLHLLLVELGFPQKEVAALCEDNQAAIHMVNEHKPTPHVPHINAQCFAVQEWCKQTVVQLAHTEPMQRDHSLASAAPLKQRTDHKR
jgi:hypothetical protein